MSNNVRFKLSIDDKVSSQLDKIRDKFDRIGKTGAAKNILMGVGVGVGIQAWNTLGNAIGSAVGWLADAPAAAAAEQAEIAKLNAALAGNVPAWESQAAAIEKGIKAGERLAFSDDEVRESLAKLVPVTHDVTRAFRLQRTAMDLARLKGISLADASQMLIDIEGGRYRALAKLIGSTKEIKTETEALAAVERAAAGQAAAYTETLTGKTATLNNKLDNLQETIGGAVTPALDDLAGALLDVIEVTDGASPPVTNLTNDIANLAGALKVLGFGGGWVESLADGVTESGRLQAKAADLAIQGRRAAFALSDAGKAAGYAAGKMSEAGGPTGKVEAHLEAISRGGSAAVGVIMRDLASGTGKAEGAIRDLNPVLKTLDQRLENIADAGNRAVDAINEARLAASWIGGGVEGGLRGADLTPKKKHKKKRAMGGSVIPGEVYTVGEAGPETLVMGQVGGYVIPNGRGGGGSPVVVQLNLDGREVARVVDRHLYYEAARAPRSSYAG